MKSQAIMKTDTSENWAKCEDKYIPAPFTIIVYQDLDKVPKIKISDGVSLLKDLPFLNLQVNGNSVKEYKIKDDILEL